MLGSRFMRSKIGGQPAWLNLRDLPSIEEMKCGKCQNPMLFLLQIYATEDFGEDPNCFHRTLFVFFCPKPECHQNNDTSSFLVLRNQLARKNEFYSYESPQETKNWQPEVNASKYVQLCRTCGCRGDKTCNKCKQVHYCSRDCQIHDWNMQHKKECSNVDFKYVYQEGENIPEGPCGKNPGSKIAILPQYEVVIQVDDEVVSSSEDESDTVDVKKELEKIKELEQGSEVKLSKADLADFLTEEETVKDKNFKRFLKVIQCDKRQIIRYHRMEEPLWVSTDHIPTDADIANCEYCGGKRVFEFQIMPQLLNIVKLDNNSSQNMNEATVDWGTIAIYTCEKSCNSSGNQYKREFAWKQTMP